MKLKPNNKVYLRIGIQYAPHIRPVNSLTIVAKDLGCTKQLAWYYTHVALGKLIYRLKQNIPDL